MYSLCDLLIFPVSTRTPGTILASVLPLLPLMEKTSATLALPFSTPLMETFFLLMAVYSKSLRKVWISLCILGIISNCLRWAAASELISVPKVKILAEQVEASSKSIIVISPTSDFNIFTFILCFYFNFSIIGSICSWIVSSIPLSANCRITLKLFLLTPMLTKN